MFSLIAKILDSLVLGILAVMGVVLFIQVFMRYIFNTPLIWSEELARYLMVWYAFLGAGWGVYRKVHISLSILVEKLPEVLQKIIGIVCLVANIVCFAWLIPYAWEFVVDQHTMRSSAMQLPMSFVSVPVLIGLVFLCLFLARDLFIMIAGKNDQKEEIQ